MKAPRFGDSARAYASGAGSVIVGMILVLPLFVELHWDSSHGPIWLPSFVMWLGVGFVYVGGAVIAMEAIGTRSRRLGRTGMKQWERVAVFSLAASVIVVGTAVMIAGIVASQLEGK